MVAQCSSNFIYHFLAGLLFVGASSRQRLILAQTARRLRSTAQRKTCTWLHLDHQLTTVTETLLNKSGGYLSNDVMPPGLFMDNMPSWEFGALEMSRDLHNNA
ncbi:DUF2333 family protein [Paraglaciecola sp. Hal342]